MLVLAPVDGKPQILVHSPTGKECLDDGLCGSYPSKPDGTVYFRLADNSSSNAAAPFGKHPTSVYATDVLGAFILDGVSLMTYLGSLLFQFCSPVGDDI